MAIVEEVDAGNPAIDKPFVWETEDGKTIWANIGERKEAFEARMIREGN